MLDAVVNALPRAAAVLDESGVIVAANPAWRSLTGTLCGEAFAAPGNLPEALRQSVARRCPLADALETVLSGARAEISVVCSAGAPPRIVARRLEWPGGGALVMREAFDAATGAAPGAADDSGICETSHAALRDSEQRERRRSAELEAIFETAPIGLSLALDPEGRRILGNRALETMFGVPPGGDLSKRASAPPPYHLYLDGRELGVEELPMQRAARGEAVEGQIMDVLLPDGARKTAFARATPLFDETGRPRGAVGAFMDITALKRASDSLRESEERQAFLVKLIDTLRALDDPADIMAAACRLLAEHLCVNRVSFADIHGREFAVRHSHAVGVAPFLVRMPLSELGAVLIEQYLRGESVAIADVSAHAGFTEAERARFRQGEIVALASVVVSKQGRWVGTLCAHHARPRDWTLLEMGLIRDVAERVWSAAERARALEALRESEFRLQLALSSGEIGIYEWRLASGEFIGDDRLRAQWGLPPGAPMDAPSFVAGVHDDDRRRVEALLARARDPKGDGRFAAEFRVVPADGGETRWIAATGAVFFEANRALRMVGTAQDVSERKLAEAERQKFVSLAEQSVEFIGVCSVDFMPLYINPAGLELSGLGTFHDAMRVDVAEFFFPEDRAYVFNEFFPKVLREGHASVEIRFRRFDTGEPVWMLYNVFQLRDPQGAPIGLATVSRDITERKRAEDALKDADRRKDVFLATLAHELRNPLAPIRNAVQVLRHDAGRTLKGRDLALLSMIDRQAAHLVRLVDDLLEVSRITRGKIELRKERVDLSDVLRHAIETAQPSIARGGHAIAVDLPEGPLALDADPVRLAQVFTNLLNNAAKYTERGGEISVTAERRGAEAVVTVRDSGVGIPADMLPRVFDIFTQVDRTLGRAEGGLGIGLALVKSLLEMHGGAVEAQSEGLGRGSAFVVRLPVAPVQTGEKVMIATSPADVPAGRRVLVIDDDHDVADSLVMFLETFGVTVDVAYGGAPGIEALQSFRPELVFLDLGMPGMDGYETARRIRALPEGRDVRLVALTGWGQEQIHDRARAAGFDAELTKPAGLEALQDALRSV
jgi:PAS domain S-box-containing protein